MKKCENCWSDKVYLEFSQCQVIAGLNSTLSIVTLTSNIVVIVSIVKTKQLNNASNVFICCLSISDCCLACIAQTLISFTFLRQEFSCSLEMVTQFSTSFFGHLSGYCIVAIAVDRMIHMKYLTRYAQIVTRERIYMICLANIVMSLVVGVSYTLTTIYDVYDAVNTIILIFDSTLVILTFSAYLVTFRKIHRHIKNKENLRMRKNRRSKKKRSDRPVYATTMMKVIAKIRAAVWIAYTPYITVSLVWSFAKDMYRTNENLLSFVLYLSYLLVYMNSTMNAVIFFNGNEASSSFLAREFYKACPNSILRIIETSQSAPKRVRFSSNVSSFSFISQQPTELFKDGNEVGHHSRTICMAK